MKIMFGASDNETIAGRFSRAISILLLGALAVPGFATISHADTLRLGPTDIGIERARKTHSAPARSTGSRFVRSVFGAPVPCPPVEFGLLDTIWQGRDGISRYAMPVGYNNVQSDGRARCREGISSSYVTQMRFPVNLIPDEWIIESARLVFEESRVRSGNNPRASAAYCKTGTGWIGINNGPYREGRATVDSHGEFRPLARASAQYLDNTSRDGAIEVDATAWVRMWHGGYPNRGLAFYPRNLDLKKNNRTCVADIGQAPIRLVITAN